MFKLMIKTTTTILFFICLISVSQKVQAHEMKIFSTIFTIDATDSTKYFIMESRENPITTVKNPDYISAIKSEISNLQHKDTLFERVILLVALIPSENSYDTLTLTPNTNFVRINDKFYFSTFKLIDLLTRYIPIADSHLIEFYQKREWYKKYE